MLKKAVILALLAGGCRPAAEPGRTGVAGGGAPEPLRPAPVRPFRIPRVDAVLLITGSTYGRLEVCNCPGPMSGGLSRRSGLVLSYRRAYGRVLLLDTGDVFGIRAEDIRNRYVLQGYRAVGYDAVVLADNEWAALPGMLPAALRASPMAYLSTSASCPAGRLPLKTQVVRRLGKTRLALLSYLGPGTMQFLSGASAAGVVLARPEEVIRRAGRLKQDGCVVVLVAHATEVELEPFRDAPGVDLIVRGHTTHPAPGVLRLGSIPLLKVGGSEQVGAAALQLERGRIAALEFRQEIVDDQWPLDRRLLDIYQACAHEVMREALKGEPEGGLEYVSSATCGRCHEQQHRAWRQGPHRRAWQVLVEARREGDANCLICHTSGFGTAGGFRSRGTTAHLAGVNCQDCHRFNLKPQRGKQAARAVTEDTCTLCHTPFTSPAFDYAKYRARVGCAQVRPATHGGR